MRLLHKNANIMVNCYFICIVLSNDIPRDDVLHDCWKSGLLGMVIRPHGAVTFAIADLTALVEGELRNATFMTTP